MPGVLFFRYSPTEGMKQDPLGSYIEIAYYNILNAVFKSTREKNRLLEAEAVWVKDDDELYPDSPGDEFACLYKGSKRIAILDDMARSALLENAPDLFRDSPPVHITPPKAEVGEVWVAEYRAPYRNVSTYTPNVYASKPSESGSWKRVPVIGAPIKGECTCDDIGDGPCPRHARECALQDRAISAENDLKVALQRAESAERANRSLQLDANDRDKALKGALADAERRSRHFSNDAVEAGTFPKHGGPPQSTDTAEELSDTTHPPTQKQPERRKEDEFLRKARKAWSEWVLHLFELTTLNPDGSRTLSARLVQRWERLTATPYADDLFAAEHNPEQGADKDCLEE